MGVQVQAAYQKRSLSLTRRAQCMEERSEAPDVRLGDQGSRLRRSLTSRRPQAMQVYNTDSRIEPLEAKGKDDAIVVPGRHRKNLVDGGWQEGGRVLLP